MSSVLLQTEIVAAQDALAAGHVPATMLSMMESPAAQLPHLSSSIATLVAECHAAAEPATLAARARNAELYRDYVHSKIDQTALLSATEPAQIPRFVHHVRSVLATDHDAEFDIVSHAACLDGAGCELLMKFASTILELKVNSCRCVSHNVNDKGIRFVRPDGTPIQHLLSADIQGTDADVREGTFKSLLLCDHHGGDSQVQCQELCKACGTRSGVATNCCQYNTKDLATCPCGMSILWDILGGAASGLTPPHFTPSVLHALWITDFFDHGKTAEAAAHPHWNLLCLVLRTFMWGGACGPADATEARLAKLLFADVEELVAVLTETLDKIPGVVREVLETYDARTLFAVGDGTRVVLVDNTDRPRPVRDPMLYQQLIDTHIEEGIKTLWLTVDKVGLKIKYGMRRAGPDCDCQAITEKLQRKYGKARIVGGGHPYAAAALVDVADAEWFSEVLLECLQECINVRPLVFSVETPTLVPMTRLDPMIPATSVRRILQERSQIRHE